MSDEAGDLVLSEVHLNASSCQGVTSSRFHYLDPEDAIASSSSGSEDDGARRKRVRRRPRRRHVELQHAMATPLSCCGEQVWRGACLLADAMLAPRGGARAWRALELGCGAGLLLALAERLGCPLFIATDSAASALHLAAANAARARGEQPAPAAAGPASAGRGAAATSEPGFSAALVRHLSWFPFLGVDPHQLTDHELLQLLNGRPLDCTGGASTGATVPPHQQHQQHHHHHQQQHQQHHHHHQQQQQQHHHHHHHHQQQQQQQSGAPPPFCWAPEDLRSLASVDTLLAADVIYDPPLTEAFAHAATCLMAWVGARRRRGPRAAQERGPGGGAAEDVGAAGAGGGSCDGGGGGTGEALHEPAVRLLLAAEKRFNFTLSDADRPRAAAWEHFMSYVEAWPSSGAANGAGEGQQLGSGGVEGQLGSGGAGGWRPLVGRRLDMPPQLMDYDRSPDLELWELRLAPPR